MNCPKCAVALVMSERQGVEIDYCPRCRGVWLDRGELDKVIERSESYSSRGRDDDDDDDDDRRRSAPPYQQPPPPGYPPTGHGYPPPHYHYKKKKSFWSELFD